MKKLILLTIAIFALSTAFSQTLKRGNLIGLHSYEITLLEDVTPEQFEKFYIEKYIPAFEESMPGVKVLLLKGERGEYKNKYGALIYFKSMKERDYWIPEPGAMSEKGQEAMDSLSPLIDKLDSMMTYERKYTDWVIL